MKFTKFMAASFAVLTMFSCSKEIMDNNGPELKPGDVQFAFKLGKTSTTYATAAQEKGIYSLQAFVFEVGGTAEGKLVRSTLLANISTGANANETASPVVTISATDIDDATSNDVEIYFVANSVVLSGIKTKADFLKAKISKDINVITSGELALATGLPAILNAGTFTMSSGVTTVGPTNLTMKKVAARVSIIDAAAADNSTKTLEGYTVSFTKAYDGVNPSTIVETTADYSGINTLVIGTYTVKGMTEADMTNTYAKQEAVAYLYPTDRMVEVVVTDADGNTAQTSFIPVANKNYKIKVVKKAGFHTHTIASISIEEWSADEEHEANFNAKLKLVDNNISNLGTNGVEVKNGTFIIPAGVTTSIFDINKLIEGYDFAEGVYAYGIEFVEKTKVGVSDFTLVDQEPNITITAPLNYSGADYTGVSLRVWIAKDGNDNVEEIKVPVIVKSQVPVGFLVDMGGLTFAAVDSRNTGSLSDDINVFNTINNDPLGASKTTFADKLIAYISSNVANYDLAVGPSAAAAAAKCPNGFKLPSLPDYKTLIAGTFNFQTTWTAEGSGATQYHVRAPFGSVENIKDWNGVVVDVDRSVGIGLTGHTASGKSSYRRLEYKGNAIILAIQPTSQTFGGVRTSDGNVGLNGNDSSVTLYTQASGAGSLQTRCVKDAMATGIIW